VPAYLSYADWTAEVIVGRLGKTRVPLDIVLGTKDQVAPPAWQERKTRPEAGKSAHGAAESAARSTEQSLARPWQPEIATSTAMGGGGESESSAPRSSGLAPEGLPPGDGATNSGGDGQPLRHYLQHIRERISRYKKYPPMARRRQLEGRVGIRFLLSVTGEVQRLAISRSSGEELLDQAALKAVQDGSPFPRPPVDLPADPITIELNIVFNLS
jgi:TonB family protein